MAEVLFTKKWVNLNLLVRMLRHFLWEFNELIREVSDQNTKKALREFKASIEKEIGEAFKSRDVNKLRELAWLYKFTGE